MSTNRAKFAKRASINLVKFTAYVFATLFFFYEISYVVTRHDKTGMFAILSRVCSISFGTLPRAGVNLLGRIVPAVAVSMYLSNTNAVPGTRYIVVGSLLQVQTDHQNRAL